MPMLLNVIYDVAAWYMHLLGFASSFLSCVLELACSRPRRSMMPMGTTKRWPLRSPLQVASSPSRRMRRQEELLEAILLCLSFGWLFGVMQVP